MDWALVIFCLFFRTTGSPTEVWSKKVQQTGQDAFLLQDHSTGLGLDLDWTHSRIWSSLIDSIGSPMDCPAGSIGIGWVWSKSIGIHWKMGGSVKYTFFWMIHLHIALQAQIECDHESWNNPFYLPSLRRCASRCHVIINELKYPHIVGLAVATEQHQ